MTKNPGKFELVLVNCSVTIDQLWSQQVHVTPMDKRYLVEGCKYMAVYADRKIQLVARIKGVGHHTAKTGEVLATINGAWTTPEDIAEKTRRILATWVAERDRDYTKQDAQVIFLDEMTEVNLSNDSGAPHQIPCMFINITHLDKPSIEAIKNWINNTTWENFCSRNKRNIR